MKKLLITLGLVASCSAMAQGVGLACQGSIIENTKHTKHPSLNVNNKKDWVMFNVGIYANEKSLVIDDSYYFENTKFSNLQITNSDYAIFNSDSKNSIWTTMIINRYTGNYSYSYTNISKTGIRTDFTSNGTCQLNSQWQAKF